MWSKMEVSVETIMLEKKFPEKNKDGFPKAVGECKDERLSRQTIEVHLTF